MKSGFDYRAGTVSIPLSRMFVGALSLMLATSLVSSVDRRPQACATEPTGQFLEQLQRDAYGMDVYWLGALSERRETATRIAGAFPNGTPGFPSPHLRASLDN